jgi:RNA polymerase sigma factor (sigma-70 family)
MTRDSQSLPRAVHRLRAAIILDRPTVSDADLLRKFRESRDPAAFETLVRRHAPVVMSACRKVLSEDADVEDAFQAAFLILLRDGHSIKKDAAVGSWLYGVAHRVSLKVRAARRRRAAVEAKAEVKSESVNDLSWREAVTVLHEELDRLPDKYRLPLMLCYLEGLSRDEAGHRLGLSLNTIRNRLERGRDRLRGRLQRRGIALSAGLLAALEVPTSVAIPPLLVRLVVNGSARPPARVTGLIGASGSIAAFKVVTGLAIAAALVIGVGIGSDGLRAGPSPKNPPAKELADKPAAERAAKVDPNAPERLEIKGRVLNPDGKPVKDAKVWLVTEAWAVRRTVAGPKRVATTDADGTFAFNEDGARRPRYWSADAQVVATAEGFGLGWANAAEAKDKILDLKLVKDEPISGRVLTLEGQPVAGAKVRVVEVARPAGPDLSAWLADLKAKDRPLHKLHPSHFHHEGRLIEAGGPIPGQPEPAVTDAEGRFRITGLGRERLVEFKIEGPSIATVWIQSMTRASPTLTVAEDPGDSRYGNHTYYGETFDFAAKPTQPIEGKVTDRETGKPLAGVSVRGHWKWHELSTVTDKDGKYRLTGLETGRHELIAFPTPDQPYHRMSASGGEIASQKDATVDFALTRGHWVTGKVVNVRTGKPEAGAPVHYHPLADEAAYISVPGSKAWSQEPAMFTAEDGTFRVVTFPCRGAVVVNGYSGGYITANQRPLQGDAESLDQGMRNPNTVPTSPVVNLMSHHAVAIVNVDPKNPKEYTITLDPGVTVQVKLVDADGKPVTGAGVGGQSSWSLWNANQKAEIELHQYNPDGPRSILFLHPERGIGKLVEPKKGDAGPWEVKLEPVGTATGRLVTADGKPIANAVLQIHYRLPGHDAWTPSFLHEKVRSDEKGVFRLGNLVAGVTYDLRYSTDRGAGRAQHYEVFKVKAGETKDLGDIKPRGVD